MFEFHGWVTLRLSTSSDAVETLSAEDEDARIKLIIDELSRKAAEQSGLHSFRMEFLSINVDTYWRIDGLFNHARDRANRLFELLKFAAERAPGSYGLVYWRDDDDKQTANEFRVWVVARGRVRAEDDTFLSPFIPAIEDPE